MDVDGKIIPDVIPTSEVDEIMLENISILDESMLVPPCIDVDGKIVVVFGVMPTSEVDKIIMLENISILDELMLVLPCVDVDGKIATIFIELVPTSDIVLLERDIIKLLDVTGVIGIDTTEDKEVNKTVVKLRLSTDVRVDVLVINSSVITDEEAVGVTVSGAIIIISMIVASLVFSCANAWPLRINNNNGSCIIFSICIYS